jgi:hypothetical protein
MPTFIDYILDAENTLSNYINRVDQMLIQSRNYYEVQTALATIQQEQATRQVVKVSDNTNKASEKASDRNVRLQLNASTETKVPVLYGRSVLGGKLIDAALSQGNLQLDLAFVLAMKTGNKIDGTASEILVKNVFWDNQTVQFQSDGVTVASLVDDEGNVDTRVDGKIRIWLYNNGSANQTYSIGGQPGGDDSSANNLAVDARNVMAGWTINHYMTNMVFVIVEFVFDPQAGLNRLPSLLFDLENTMTLPGDVLYDYMTNQLYGAGLDESVIKVLAG